MAALLLALKALGILLAVLLILILLALLVPVTVQLQYAKEQFTVRLRILFYTRQLWPEPPPRPAKNVARPNAGAARRTRPHRLRNTGRNTDRPRRKRRLPAGRPPRRRLR